MLYMYIVNDNNIITVAILSDVMNTNANNSASNRKQDRNSNGNNDNDHHFGITVCHIFISLNAISNRMHMVFVIYARSKIYIYTHTYCSMYAIVYHMMS